MSRTVAVLFAAALAFSPGFALAGAAEDAYLARLIGVWKGAGALTGDETAAIACTLTVRQRSEGVNFSSKCKVEGLGNQNFSAVISYNDKEGRYEAKSAGGEVTIGTRKGNTLTFNAKMKGIAVGTSVMKLSPSAIVVDTTVRRPGGDADIVSHMEMKR
jgi:hypothetical protein